MDVERTRSDRPAVLFVCLGNICRSPLAEAALRAATEARGFPLIVDSAGTGGWHIGEPPDPRAQAVARRNEADISGFRGRQLQPADFARFTHIIALDHENLRGVRALQPVASAAEVRLLLDYVPGREGQAVTDPYFGEDTGFDATWADVTEGAEYLLRALTSRE